MSLPALLAMMTGGAGAGAALPPLSELVTVKCAVCIDALGPDARHATTLAHGTLTCDEHAAQLVTRRELDSDNLAALRELAEHRAAESVAERVAAVVASYRMATDPTRDSATPAGDTPTRDGRRYDSTAGHWPPCGVAQCVTCYPRQTTRDSDSDSATGAGQ